MKRGANRLGISHIVVVRIAVSIHNAGIIRVARIPRPEPGPIVEAVLIG